jgi:hypothetical protein
MNYDLKAEDKKFTVEIDSAKQYGCFEHHTYGDEMGGGLWFENKILIDFDGMMVLPKEVANLINKLGYYADPEEFCE